MSLGSTYPHNNVFATEQGILFEIDNSDCARRIHMYHPSNTFFEISEEGNVILKNKTDWSEIVGKDKKKYVWCDEIMTVDGNQSLRVGQNQDIEILKNKGEIIHGGRAIFIAKDTTTKTSGHYNICVDKNYYKKVVKDNKISIEGNNCKVVFKEEQFKIYMDARHKYKMNYNRKIDMDYHSLVDMNEYRNVEMDRHITIKMNDFLNVDIDRHKNITNDDYELIMGDKHSTVFDTDQITNVFGRTKFVFMDSDKTILKSQNKVTGYKNLDLGGHSKHDLFGLCIKATAGSHQHYLAGLHIALDAALIFLNCGVATMADIAFPCMPASLPDDAIEAIEEPFVPNPTTSVISRVSVVYPESPDQKLPYAWY